MILSILQKQFSAIKSMRKTTFHFYLYFCFLLFLVFAHTTYGQTPYSLSDRISSYYVNSFTEGPNGYIWIGTNHGLNRFSGSNYSIFYAQKDSFSLNNDDISTLMTDSDGRLWVATECGLSVYEKGRFRHLDNNGFNIIRKIVELDKQHLIITDRQGVAKIDKSTLKEVERFSRDGMSLIEPLIVSKEKQIWVANAVKSAHFILILDTHLKHIKTLVIPNQAIISGICKDNEGLIWVTTDKGLLCYESHFFRQISLPNTLKTFSNDKIQFVQNYGSENILIGIRGKGIYAYNKRNQSIIPINRQEKLNRDTYVCFVDSHQNIWLSDKNNGVQFYPQSLLLENITALQSTLIDPFIKNIFLDKEQHIWVRTTNDIACYDHSNDKILYHSSEDKPYGCLYIDSRNNLWTITKYNQLNKFSLKEAIPHLEKTITFQSNIFSISEDHTGRIWVSLIDRFAIIDHNNNVTYQFPPKGIAFSSLYSIKPVNRMFLYTMYNGIYELGKDQQFKPLQISTINPNSIHIDHQSNYWIGTFNNGLIYYNAQTKSAVQYDNTSGLTDNNIKAITEDNKGNIWFSTSSLITEFDPTTKTFFNLYDNQFSNGKMYAINCVAKSDNGTIYFGGAGGITAIYPETKEKETNDIPLNFDIITVNGKVLTVVPKSLNLNYHENMITIWYSGLDFKSATFLNYAYKLEGYDKDWINAGNNKRVVYSNLPAGNYVFKVKVRRGNGEWSTKQLHLNIRVEPAPWLSPIAKVIYIIIGLVLLYTLFHAFTKWKIQKERLVLSEKEKEMTQERVDFLTNISHELRTPISLIYAPVEELHEKNELDNHDKELFATIYRNTQRLIQLTEQLLNPRKQGVEEKKLKVEKGDLAAYVRYLTDNFRFLASDKEITLHANTTSSVIGWFDHEKIEKIISNLMSNAIKYTLPSGNIYIDIRGNGQNAEIQISDTGIGITEDKAKEIFQRFNRLNRETTEPHIPGNGIGLHYAQYLAHLHKGSIRYAPSDPQGASFTLTIPIAENEYERYEISTAIHSESQTARQQRSVAFTENKDKTILIVEDNSEVRDYLYHLLAEKYNIEQAQNGEEAIEKLSVHTPDLVISDVVMPLMNGYELCNQIKNTMEFGHIPIVLLTAKTEIENHIKGLQCGADAYINKPFHPQHLQVTIENIINNRKRIQQIVKDLTSTSSMQDVEELQLNEHDQNLLKNIHTQMDLHLADEDFNINLMAKEMGISYSSLYAKVKALTGQTPQVFFNTYRMNTAMHLLQTGKYTVSEVSYKVGISSLASFSRSFKRQFGIPPSNVAPNRN